MNLKFILFVALRYLKAKKKSKKISSSVLLIVCLSLGVMALFVVIGIMNGFQLTFIEPILNIGSYHIQVSGGNLEEEQLSSLRSLPGITACVPFCEFQGLVNGKSACLVRAIPANIQELDPAFRGSFKTSSNNGKFDVPDYSLLSIEDGIMTGNLLSLIAKTDQGRELSMITLTGNPVVNLKVTGIFKTGYDDIDSSWGLVSLETAQRFTAKGERLAMKYGIKLTDRFYDTAAVNRIKNLLGEKYKVQSWRVFNSKFFTALLTEKIVMSLILGLIFLIVAFGIFHSLKKSVHEKIEEIALLKALGASSSAIKNIFMAEGFLLGMIGVLAGTVLGLLVGYNINPVFRLTETVVNKGLFPLLTKLLSPFMQAPRFAPISIFSPDVYYIDKVPVRILPEEAVFINTFGIVCCMLAAWFASRKIAEFKPATVLRYE